VIMFSSLLTTRSLAKKIQNKSALWLIKRAFDKISILPVSIRLLYFFKYTGEHKSKLIPRFSGTIRWGSEQDLPGILRCSNPGKNNIYLDRFKQGEKCLVAIDKDGNTAGYGWLSLKQAHTEDKTNIVFEFPQQSIYAYDIFVQPRYRLTGLWVGLIQLILNSEYYDPTSGLYCFVSHGNHASLRPHIRYGFELFEQQTIVTVLNRSFSIKKPLRHDESTVKRLLNTI